MSATSVAALRADRISNLSAEAFISDYLEKNRPVVVTGAMRGWKALDTWTPEVLARRFGSEKVQVYGDLFRLAAITTLAEYLNKYFGKEQPVGSAPYVRWYCHLANDERVPWADDAFDSFCEDWARPSFFPDHSFVLPYCGEAARIDPSHDWFPARGLFISARGARTRLHADPRAATRSFAKYSGAKNS